MGNGALATGPKLPRPSSTLPREPMPDLRSQRFWLLLARAPRRILIPHPGSNNMARTADTFSTLATRRLRLRQFEPRDAAGVHACFGDQDAMRFWNFLACKTMAETEKSLRWLGKRQLQAVRLLLRAVDQIRQSRGHQPILTSRIRRLNKQDDAAHAAPKAMGAAWPGRPCWFGALKVVGLKRTMPPSTACQRSD
jgi:hypothetical protein